MDTTILHSIKNINMSGTLEFNRNLKDFTTFQVGGPADILAFPGNQQDLLLLIRWARQNRIPWMILGGGANILVSDKGVRGLVIATSAMNDIRLDGELLIAGPGSRISDAAAFAADHNLEGLDFIYAMPGSTGGAVWMNARCYGGEISEILEWVDYIDGDRPDQGVQRLIPGVTTSYGDFAYKKTPFQVRPWIILESAYRLTPGSGNGLWKRMKELEDDRRNKGHFAAPCAGSVFKNNRSFGAPSGKLIDSLNMRGLQVGGAKISDQHANIIINTGNARASDIAEIIDRVQSRVEQELGFLLEPEVLKVGEWD